MDFRCSINGLAVEAVYPERSVEGIFRPLLRRLDELQKEKSRRIVVMLAAPPGAGKSTLSLFLQNLSRDDPSLTPLTAVGMDGFHCYRDYLAVHTIVRDGEEIPLSRIKGAPETFDLGKLRERIELLCSGADTPWPHYDRTLHDPVDGAILVTGKIVLIEGNYLLLDEPGWRELPALADYTIRIDAPEGQLPVRSKIAGLLRGILRDGYPVLRGFKLADVDPRLDELKNCATISDKARCIAGSVLELVSAQANRERRHR